MDGPGKHRQATRLVAGLVVLLFAFVPMPASADHVAVGQIQWACGFGGGQEGHPDACGIDPVGGGDDVGEDGPVTWGPAWTEPSELILGLVVEETAYAIPVRMLDAHEIANIEVGGVAIAVTYCPLCGSGVAFLRELRVDGEVKTLDFTASGFLYQDDLVMWDPQTHTLWNQISGRPIASLLDRTVIAGHIDVELETVPLLVASWRDWQEAHPDSVMLQMVRSNYGDPYGAYAASGDGCGLATCTGVDARLHPKAMVLGVARPTPIAFAIDALQVPALVAHEGRSYVATPTVSGGHQVLDATGVGLTMANGTWTDADGDVWDLVGNMDVSGQSLPIVPSLRLFWFAWEGHYPETELWHSGTTVPVGEFDNGRLPGFYIPLVAGLLVVGALVYRWRKA